jgi:maltose O-acetyltransferase
MFFGEYVQIVSRVACSEFVTAKGGRLEVGDRVYINYGASIAAHSLIQIGAHTLIGTHCIIMDNDYHHVDVAERHTLPESRPIIIGDHVWIGARVTILKGVTIGEYAVIGAGSVVTRDVPPFSLVAGVPAKVIRRIAGPDVVEDRIHASLELADRSFDHTSLSSLLCFGAVLSQLAI